MPAESCNSALRQKIKQRLGFYEDLGLAPFYRDRAASLPVVPAIEEPTLPKAAKSVIAPAPAARLLFEPAGKTSSETLLEVREDLGECTRCKLHRTRNKIVFGDGSAQAQLVFVGEGPGADENGPG